MAYEEITEEEIKVGKAVKKEIFRKTRNSLIDHENRITSLSLGAAPIVIFNSDVQNASSARSLTGFAYWRSYVAFTLSTVMIQIFQKGIVTSGILSVDIKKGPTPDDGTMVSMLTTLPQINFATAPDYASAVGIINPSNQAILVNDILRFDVTSLPSIPLGKFRILVYGNI